MPRVLLEYAPEYGEYFIHEKWDWEPTEYETIVHLKASHFRNIMKNRKRVMQDQEFLNKFFIQAQQAGREIVEQ